MQIECRKCHHTFETDGLRPDEAALCPQCAADSQQQPTDSPDSAVPRQIGRFPVKRLIGHGGMCRVYEGMHPELNIPVAIKIPRESYLQDREFCSRFSKSARICAKISHPNIVKVYEYGEDTSTGIPYLVMEYIGGGTLCDLLAVHGCFSAGETIKIAHAICRGLLVAEKHGIVHRDIKPDNIMISSDGQYKLADLGLAKQEPVREDRSSAQILQEGLQTRTGDMYSLGTLEFMPPEQLLNAAACDSRADIYSLGVTLYQLATGRLPIECGENEDFRHLLLTREPYVPSKYNDRLPLLFDYIVMSCIQKMRRFRYQTFTELDQDLEAFLLGNDELPSMRIAPPQLETHTSAKAAAPASKGLIISAVLLFIAIVVIAGFLTAKMLSKNTKESVSGIQHVQQEQQPQDEATTSAQESAPAESEEDKIQRQIERNTASATVSVFSADQEVADARQQELFLECTRKAEKALADNDGFLKVIDELKGFITSDSEFQMEAARLNIKLEEQCTAAVNKLMADLDTKAAPLIERQEWTNAAKVYMNVTVLQEESQQARDAKIKQLGELKEQAYQSSITPMETN